MRRLGAKRLIRESHQRQRIRQLLQQAAQLQHRRVATVRGGARGQRAGHSIGAEISHLNDVGDGLRSAWAGDQSTSRWAAVRVAATAELQPPLPQVQL